MSEQEVNYITGESFKQVMMKDENTERHMMNEPLDRLLQLVDEGNPDDILAEVDLESKFNELMKYSLVTMEDEKVFLTDEGKMAREEGVENFIKRMEKESVQDGITDLPEKAEIIPPIFFTKNRKLWSLGILLLILLGMFFTLLDFAE